MNMANDAFVTVMKWFKRFVDQEWELGERNPGGFFSKLVLLGD